MAYCPRCGVEVEDRLDACPLCDTPIPADVRVDPSQPRDYPDDVIPPKPMYRPLTARQKRMFFRGGLVFLAFFPILLTTTLDLSRNGSVTWSYFVIVPIVGALVIASLFVQFGRKPLVSVTGTLLTVIAVLVIVGLRTSAPVLAAVPYFVVVFVLLELLLLYLSGGGRRPSGIVAMTALVLTLLISGIEVIGKVQQRDFVFAVGGDNGWWSLPVAAVLLPIAVFSLYLQSVRRKGLNLGGFFFLDLTVMLVFLDVTITGGVGWSIVTSLVFIPISAILYVLHIALFNDTDWRKALHL
ncbi:MAG: zinc ribbon domain-containing protein [Alkalispirochaeta sp.]